MPIFAGREERIEVRFRSPGPEGPAAFWDVAQICVTWVGNTPGAK